MEKKKIKLYLLLVFGLFVFALYFSLKDNYMDIINALANVNVMYLIFGIILVLLSRYFAGLILYNLSLKEKKTINLKLMMKISLIYCFFAGITPGAIGGESFTLFYLKDSGLSYGKASDVVMQKFILYEISLVFVNLVAVILNLFTDIVPNTSLVNMAIIVNFTVNILFLVFLFLVTYNKKFNHFIMNRGLSFLHKIRIVKDLDKTKSSLDEYLDNFNDGVDKLRKDKKLLVKLTIYSVISFVLFLLVAYPVARALNINNISIVNMFILVTYARMMCLLIVTPGNSGGAEYSFIYMFTGLLGEEDIMAYMLIWRFVTYYIPLIVGGICAITWEKGDEK